MNEIMENFLKTFLKFFEKFPFELLLILDISGMSISSSRICSKIFTTISQKFSMISFTCIQNFNFRTLAVDLIHSICNLKPDLICSEIKFPKMKNWIPKKHLKKNNNNFFEFSMKNASNFVWNVFSFHNFLWRTDGVKVVKIQYCDAPKKPWRHA